jgi:hypothetical protein
MIQERQRLPLLMKTKRHQAALHIALHQLERDLLAVIILAYRPVDHAHAATTGFFENLIGADFLARRQASNGVGLEKISGAIMRIQQTFYFGTKFFIRAARGLQILAAGFGC